MAALRIFLLGLLLICAGCSPGAQVSYQPPFAPIKFSVDTSGQITTSVEARLVTFVGVFAIEGRGSAALVPEPGETLLTVRHRMNGVPYDSVYRLATDRAIQIQIVGTVDIRVEDRQVLIDCTTGQVSEFEVFDAGGTDGDLPALQSVDLATAPIEELRAAESGPPTAIEFVNEYTADLEIIRVDSTGQFYLYKELTPGASYVQQTFVGSSWLAREVSGERLIIGFWRASDEPSRAGIKLP